MLQARYSRANMDRSYTCASCDSLINGPRLLCLDCAAKDKGLAFTVDLCTMPGCIDAHIGIESPHEPTHRLVKFRTTVTLRNYGRVYRKACEAFGRAREFCLKIAESSSHLHETEPHGGKPSSFEPTSTETAIQSDQQDDICTGPNFTEGGSEMEDKTAPHAAQDQDLPTCGQCKGGLSFPFWYCIVCKGQSQG